MRNKVAISLTSNLSYGQAYGILPTLDGHIPSKNLS